MGNEMIKVKAREFQQLVCDVNLIKKVLYNKAVVFDSEGILNDFVLKEMESSKRQIENGSFVSNEEILRNFNIK